MQDTGVERLHVGPGLQSRVGTKAGLWGQGCSGREGGGQAVRLRHICRLISGVSLSPKSRPLGAGLVWPRAACQKATRRCQGTLPPWALSSPAQVIMRSCSGSAIMNSTTFSFTVSAERRTLILENEMGTREMEGRQGPSSAHQAAVTNVLEALVANLTSQDVGACSQRGSGSSRERSLLGSLQVTCLHQPP